MVALMKIYPGWKLLDVEDMFGFSDVNAAVVKCTKYLAAKVWRYIDW